MTPENNLRKLFTKKTTIVFASVSILLIGSIIAALVLTSRGQKSTSKDQTARTPNSQIVTPTSSPTSIESTATPTISSTISPTASPTTSPQTSQLMWQQTVNGWRAVGTPPACKDSGMVKDPTDLSKVTSILYPGQTRGGNYKPHGGFRFDKALNNNIFVRAPFDGFVIRGAAYLAEGEIQYTFDVMNNCGVMYRVGHFRELPADMLELTKGWRNPVEGDSRTTEVRPPVYISEGHLLATAVGIKSSKNVFFDFGVYDYRSENEASKSASFRQMHEQDKVLSWHGVCWFDWMGSASESRVRSLPAADSQSGKTSDYCK